MRISNMFYRLEDLDSKKKWYILIGDKSTLFNTDYNMNFQTTFIL